MKILTKNIRFINFEKNIYRSKKNLKKEYIKFKKQKWINKYPLLKTFTNNFKYSYPKSIIKKYKKINKIRIIGMGGSILGTEAIYSFMKEKIKKKFTFINNLNPTINDKGNDLNIIISKSGETLETISNFHLLQKFKKTSKNIFITEDSNNYLREIAGKIKSAIFEHKNYIGGRYSVLSEVGMLPAELMGLNIKKFKRLNYLINNKSFVYNLISNVGTTLNFIKNKKYNSVILNYDEHSENLYRWYQQLISESLGKKSKGIIPLLSTMPKDNHSLLQLYLDGPKNNFFTFHSVKNYRSEKIDSKNLLKSKYYLKNKTLSQIINAQRVATQNIFQKKKIPYRSFEILNRTEETLGEIFCFFVLETIMLGNALKVNPFDQPSVELIKIETKKILSRS